MVEIFSIYQYTRPLNGLFTSSDYLIWSSDVCVVEKVVDTIFDVHDFLLRIVKATAYDDDSIYAAKTQTVAQAKEMITKLIYILN